MRIHQLSPLNPIASLNSTAAGLSYGEAERRLHEYGRNKVEQVARGHLWLRFIKEFTTFFSLILWVRGWFSSLNGAIPGTTWRRWAAPS